MIRKTLVGLLVVCVALVFGSSAFAKRFKYEEGAVSGGGSISGTVSLKGNPPPPIMEDLNKGKNVEFCATHPDTKKGNIRPRVKVVAKGGKLSGTVVFIENISKGKAWNWKTSNFDFKTCDIFPKVAVIKKPSRAERKTGKVVTITNHDPDILHNPHGYSVKGASRKTLFNKPLPSKGDVADVTKNIKRLKKKKDSHFFLQCDQHNFMEADARIIWNPYYAVTGTDGAFKITDIPAGKYKVTAWHPYVGEVTSEVTVAGGADAKTNFTLTAK
ncbi:carboxypeptidase regulatory-like domain-containing protein [Candidatus Saccharibacteria bacterium]|nr:carboxypeptidase regulatory-like domain-containing protein [Candidatus Saccharibacteria bacterium]NIV04259.1 carboxypeptidase regulatory-like domain-containing protein [Calditrichia bacterium]NIV71924.1 carboxypeptidase regulatory-like domain-containing protein [Calditrichia bacterium]NIV99036.1 carboxypeptidase regulatory-like domain-containing protein [Candidatus Saccharibacteria bacterium]NIW80281.1 carboxypeptidase regulatory-like domain-containing protein [Calditrichia bacterium]